MSYLQEWRDDIRNAIKAKDSSDLWIPAGRYHSCATGAKICDMLKVTPADLGQISGGLKVAMNLDPEFDWMSLDFYSDVNVHDLDHALEVIEKIDRATPSSELLNRVKKLLRERPQ